MREPRPRQRLPEGGLDIYERQKSGPWKPGTEILTAYPDGYRLANNSKDVMLSWGYVLFYQPHFDPMLYFWPCENFHILFIVDNHDADITKKLVRASLRDGAEVVATHVRDKLTASARLYDQEDGWEKPAYQYEYTVRKPSKQNRYEMTLAAIREQERAR